MDEYEIIQKVMSNSQKIAHKYTYPVFISDLKNKPDLIASSVIIEISKKYYFVTASHVLLNALYIGGQFVIGVNGLYVTIKGEFVYSNHQQTDHFDIAYIELSQTFIEKNKICVLKEEKLITHESFPSVHVAFIHGFPNSMNKQSKALYRTSSFKVKAYAYGGVIKGNFNEWEILKKNEEIHTCMTYGKKSDFRTPINPKGISGGGLWIVPNVSKPKKVYLDSILIEYHEKHAVTFSTKINQVINFINSTT